MIDALSGTPQLIVKLLYGSGLRLMECLRLRIKDVDFVRGEIIVRDGKGMKDRVTMLPGSGVLAPEFIMFQDSESILSRALRTPGNGCRLINSQSRVSCRYLMRWGRSASTPRRLLRLSSYSE